jgi:hypothetical protein
MPAGTEHGGEASARQAFVLMRLREALSAQGRPEKTQKDEKPAIGGGPRQAFLKQLLE